MTALWVEELVRRGKLDAEQAARVTSLAEERGGAPDTALLELGWVEEAAILSAMAGAYDLEVGSPSAARAPADAGAMRAFPEQLARKHVLAPLELDAERAELRVLAAAPHDPAALERLGGLLELKLVPVLTTELRVHERMGVLYGAPIPERLQPLLAARARKASIAPETPRANSLQETLARLKDAAGRDEIIEIALGRARRELDFAAFLVVADEKITGRAAQGQGSESIQKVSIVGAVRSAFATAAQTQAHALGPLSPDDVRALAPLGREAPASALIVPVRVRTRAVGLFYAENGDRAISPHAASELIAVAAAVGTAFEGLVKRKKVAETAKPAPLAEATAPAEAAKPAEAVAPPEVAKPVEIAAPAEATRAPEVEPPRPAELSASALGGPTQPEAPAVALDDAVITSPGLAPPPAATRVDPLPVADDTAASEPTADVKPIAPVEGLTDPPPAPRALEEETTGRLAVPQAVTEREGRPAQMVPPSITEPEGHPPVPPARTLVDEAPAHNWGDALGPGASIPPTPGGRARRRTRVDAQLDAALEAIESEPPPSRVGAPREDTDKIRKRAAESAAEPLPVPPLASERPGAAELADSAAPRIAARVIARQSLTPAPAPGENRSAWEHHVSAAWSAWSQPPPPGPGHVAPLMGQRNSMTPLPAEIVGEADSLPPGPRDEQGLPPPELRRETWVKASGRPIRAELGREAQVVAPAPAVAEPPRAVSGNIPVARGEPIPPEHSHVVTVSGRVEKKGAGPIAGPPPQERTAVVARPSPREVAPDYEALLDRLEGHDPNASAAARVRLLEHGESAMPTIIRRFPGKMPFDAFAADPLPPLGQCGPLAELVGTLGHAAHPWVVERLDDTLPLVRLMSVHYYACVRVPEVLPRLTRRLYDGEARVAQHALTALSRYRDDRSFQDVLGHLHSRLGSPSANARRHAVELLATLGDTSAVPLLAGIFDRKDKLVFDAVELALAQLTKQRFGPSTRRWMAWWETHRKLPRAEWLLEALDGPDPDLRKSAADELRALSGIDAGFQEAAPKRARDEAKKRWTDWWASRSRAR